MSKDPDYVFDHNDWEATYEWGDRDHLTDELDGGDCKQFSTLISGPPKWAVRVVVSRDDAGEPIDTDVQWFDTEAEARKALGLDPHIVSG